MVKARDLSCSIANLLSVSHAPIVDPSRRSVSIYTRSREESQPALKICTLHAGQYLAFAFIQPQYITSQIHVYIIVHTSPYSTPTLHVLVQGKAKPITQGTALRMHDGKKQDMGREDQKTGTTGAIQRSYMRRQQQGREQTHSAPPLPLDLSLTGP